MTQPPRGEGQGEGVALYHIVGVVLSPISKEGVTFGFREKI
jgi:hypothetical protein